MEVGIEMRKRICMISLAVTMAFGLTACGNEIPDMTDAQMQMISEYAAATLLQYDINNQSRLVDLAVVEAEDAKRRAKEEAAALRQEQEAAAAQEASSTTSSEGTPVIGTDGLLESGPASMEELLELPEGVTITYRDMVVCDSYPEGTENFFSLSASDGKRFLVLKYDIYNGSGQDQAVDILSQGALFRVTVNGDVSKNAMTTMLFDVYDLTNYKDTITAGNSIEAVVIVEVESSVADNVSSLSLEVRKASETYTVQHF